MKKFLSVLSALMVIPGVHSGKLIITYDFNNHMQSVELYNENNDYSLEEGSTAFIYDPFEGVREQYEKKSEPEFPAVYGKEIYSLSAFAVVTGVHEEFYQEQNVHAVEVLFQGKENTFYMNDNIRINTAPELYSHLEGETAAVLQAGDIINISAYFSGAIREMNLVARMGNKDIITSDTNFGTNFEKLYGVNGFVHRGNNRYPICDYGSETQDEVKFQFGLIYYADSDYYLLTNKEGKSREFKVIPFEPDTIVYRCDMSKKRLTPELADVTAIQSSFILPDDIDDEENINSWSKQGRYVYALSRTVKDVATDIVIFSDFK